MPQEGPKENSQPQSRKDFISRRVSDLMAGVIEAEERRKKVYIKLMDQIDDNPSDEVRKSFVRVGSSGRPDSQAGLIGRLGEDGEQVPDERAFIMIVSDRVEGPIPNRVYYVLTRDGFKQHKEPEKDYYYYSPSRFEGLIRVMSDPKRHKFTHLTHEGYIGGDGKLHLSDDNHLDQAFSVDLEDVPETDLRLVINAMEKSQLSVTEQRAK